MLNSASLQTGATGATITGGTAVTYSQNGAVIPQGIQVADTSATDYRTQKTITFRSRLAAYNKGLWSKNKRSATVVQPKVLADGSIAFNVFRVEQEIHPESSAAEILELRMLGVQSILDSEYATFWSNGSLA